MTPSGAGELPLIDVVGGVYREWCMRPAWREIYGSAGRAAVAMASMGCPVKLHAYMDSRAQASMSAHAALNNFSLAPHSAPEAVGFDYVHGLSTPRISVPSKRQVDIQLHADNIVRFGMLEGDAVVHGKSVVYDPQDAVAPAPFAMNGSTAERLALVLNRHEASLMTGMHKASAEAMANMLLSQGMATVVVIKQGPLGALVAEGSKTTTVPAYRSSKVWKIGSGDNFVGHFAYRWMAEGKSAADSADLASRATAYYCDTAGFATQSEMQAFAMPPLKPSAQFIAGRRPKIYLAGPFFNLAQHWLVEEARSALTSMGMDVFSPFHEVGHGSAEDIASLDLAAIRDSDMVFALGDGLDSGTMYELGYANANGKPVIVYCENESEGSKKMMVGSGCQFHADFVSAVYNACWTACEL